MGVSSRLIRRRIKSVTNTRKITKAMELVAASKMRRATAAALASRRYSAAGWEMASVLAERGAGAVSHPLLAERPPKETLVILMTSHRGLAGGFNANMMKHLLTFLKTSAAAPEIEGKKTRIRFATVGRKGEEAVRRLGYEIVASFSTIADTPSLADATPVAAYARTVFLSGEFDRVVLAYTDFISALVQKPRLRVLLPVSIKTVEDMLRSVAASASPATGAASIVESDTLFEPNPAQVFDALLPRMVDVQVYQALLESSASEQSARMVAMRSASDAAKDMIGDLQFTFNQARQGAITREISEIAAGKAALEE